MENIYSVYDSKAEAFLPPFFAKTDGLAVRMFSAAANDQEHNFWRYAEDYTLFQIGTWDQTTGTLYASEANRTLGQALLFREDVLSPVVSTNNGPEMNPPTKWGDAPHRSGTSD